MRTVLCTDCFPNWRDFEILTVVPTTPCVSCGRHHAGNTPLGAECNLFQNDPRTPEQMIRPPKKKVSDLDGAELDYWVAKAMGFTISSDGLHWSYPAKGMLVLICLVADFQPSSLWAYGGPIIDQHLIRTEGFGKPGPNQWTGHMWCGQLTKERATPSVCKYGSTALQAAMRTFVASVYGKEVPLK